MRIYLQKVLQVVKALSHPVPFITFLLLFPINPGQSNGFYFNHIISGLKDLQFFAFTAVAGIAILLYSLIRYKRKHYFDREVLKGKCKWAWYNTVGLMLIGFSIPFFYSLPNTPSFRESIENHFYFITLLVFMPFCRFILGFNLIFVVFSVIQDRLKADYYDEDEFYGPLTDPDEYLEF